MFPEKQKIPWETYPSCRRVLIKMANILQLKYIYTALMNPGNWSWDISCPLWPEQSKHPIFNSVSLSCTWSITPGKQPSNQPHISLQRDNKRNSRGTKGTETSQGHKGQNILGWNKKFKLFCLQLPGVPSTKGAVVEVQGSPEHWRLFALLFSCQHSKKEKTKY